MAAAAPPSPGAACPRYDGPLEQRAITLANRKEHFMAVDPVTGLPSVGQTGDLVTDDAALFAGQVAAAQPQAATTPSDNAPGTAAGNFELLASKFEEVYKTRSMTLGTILDGNQTQFNTLYDWIKKQPGLESWMKQPGDIPGGNQVTAFSNIDFLHDNFNDRSLGAVLSSAGELATAFDGVEGDLNGLKANKLDTSSPANFIDSVGRIMNAAKEDIEKLLSDVTSAPGALTRLETSMRAAIKNGWSEDAVAYQAIKGLYGSPPLSYSPNTEVNQLWQSIGSRFVSFGDKLAPLVENAAQKLPDVIKSYNTQQAYAFLNTAINLAGGALSLGTGFSKLSLAGGLGKVLDLDQKAVSEFGGLVKTGLDILKNSIGDGRTLGSLRLPTIRSKTGGSAGNTGANLDNAVTHWIQGVAAYYGNDAIGGKQIPGHETKISGGVSYTPPEAPAGDDDYSLYYWVSSQQMVGAPHPIPQTVWTLYGIPKTAP
jgi:hypothetical protein